MAGRGAIGALWAWLADADVGAGTGWGIMAGAIASIFLVLTRTQGWKR